jgi:diketogulonate reductase-like aldo/keto reductase
MAGWKSSVRQTRRTVLKSGAAVAAMAAAGRSPGLDTESAIEARAIPATGEPLPVIGLGTSRVFDIDESPSERGPRREVLRALIDSGAALVDSSPMYRRAEAVSGDLAAELGVTDRVFWATKVWTDGREAGIAQMEQSMQRFRTAQIDLMQVHNLRDWQTHMSTIRDWKAEGRVRYTGLTTSRASAFDEMEQVILAVEPDFVQLNYSLGERDAENRLLPLCAEKGIATLINRPFMRGALFSRVGDRVLPEWAGEIGIESWGQLFLKFILGHSAVTCVIPATRKAKHMLDNLGAGTGPIPSEAQRRAMLAYLADD